jgi:hypothetical protein
MDQRKVAFAYLPTFPIIENFNKRKLHYPIKLYVNVDLYYHRKLISCFFKNTYITNINAKNVMFISKIWPQNLNTLTLTCGVITLEKNYFIPNYVSKLKLKQCADMLNYNALEDMEHLIYLELEFMNFKTNLKSFNFPKNLKTIVIKDVTLTLGCFPEGIEEIVFKSSDVTYSITKSMFPKSVKRISFLSKTSHCSNLKDLIPDNLEYLYIKE